MKTGPVVSILFRTNVASVGSAFKGMRKVQVLSLPETIKKKSTFRANALPCEEVEKPVFFVYLKVATMLFYHDLG